MFVGGVTVSTCPFGSVLLCLRWMGLGNRRSLVGRYVVELVRQGSVGGLPYVIIL